MISSERSLGALVRVSAPIAWRSDRAIAIKLAEFAATEAGSALDMLRAAELEPEPRIRRLFVRHALDEARHARVFREIAQAIDPTCGARLSDYGRAHGRRQDLYERFGRTAFLAFVHLAERRGEAHFRALRSHFEHRPELRATFERIARDERFHVGYSGRLLREIDRREPGSMKRALAKERLRSAWALWRRAGRRIGDLSARTVLALVYMFALWPFALLTRRLDPDRPGWKPSRTAITTIAQARRQF
jgi:rubrerythrin